MEGKPNRTRSHVTTTLNMRKLAVLRQHGMDDLGEHQLGRLLDRTIEYYLDGMGIAWRDAGTPIATVPPHTETPPPPLDPSSRNREGGAPS